MRNGFRNLLVGCVMACGCIGAMAAMPALALAQCSTNDPANDATLTANLNADQDIQAAFTAARAAEGCATPLVLPAGYDSMSPQQQMLWLFNNEREVRGLGDLTLDPTLMSQIALNHSLEMNQYGYFDHPSPINQAQVPNTGVNVPQETVNPVFANDFFGENIAAGFPNAATAVFEYMYVDSAEGWGHREAILEGSFTWVGIGIVQNGGGPYFGNYWTDDFSATHAGYSPPAQADTGAPALGPLTYANGTATVTGVADNPANVNDSGANPLTAGVTGVVFYTNNIVENQASSTFNTVSATQTSPGTWSAPITVGPSDVLHAVAVDGSGNYTDVTAAPPAVALTAGANTVALPAGTPAASTGPVTQAVRADTTASGQLRAVTPTAAALVASIDKDRRGVVRSVRIYTNDRWRTYRPGRSRNFPLYVNEGVVVSLRHATHWKATTEPVRYLPTLVRLHRGWNFVAAPYPINRLTCHAVRFELAAAGDKLLEISIGVRPNTGVIMRPHHGKWGDDVRMFISNRKGFWIKDGGSDTWQPNPVGYRLSGRRIR
jgi:uncharacterized protein YkwD